MDVPGVSNTQNKSDTKITDPKKSIDKDAFMKLLVEQLKNQDPLSPMDDKDFIAQTAQFTMLEEIQALRSDSSYNRAISLLGKDVRGMTINEETDAVEMVNGIVTGVSVYTDGIMLNVGDKVISPESVVGVTNGD